MRPGVGLNTSGSAATAAATSPSSASSGAPHSAWHSPVPYLFGGLAAMMGLIAFALLILACSYWKLSGFLDSGGHADGRDEATSGDGDAGKPPRLFEESIVVIMAGDCKPTFLATPIASCATSFADKGEDAADSAAAADGRKAETAVMVPRRDATPPNQSDSDSDRDQCLNRQ